MHKDRVKELERDLSKINNELYIERALAIAENYKERKSHAGENFFDKKTKKYYRIIEPTPNNPYRFTCLVFKVSELGMCLDMDGTNISVQLGRMEPETLKDIDQLPCIDSIMWSDLEKMERCDYATFHTALLREVEKVISYATRIVAEARENNFKNFSEYYDEFKVRQVQSWNG